MDCFEKYYVLNRRLLCLTGMWPNRKSKEVYFRICIFSLFLITGIFDQVQWMLQLEFKVDSIIKPLYSLIPDLCVTVGYYTGLFNSTELSQLIDCMRRDWQIPMTKRELIIMEKYANDSKMYTFLIVFYTFTLFY
ncbi:hypothetical protein KPH14_005924 [Odynerus spinipes]|uniref:Odorant receptor n=1 Tax=Odynerus spinipes TaxID=1348599 RepID=A0AAD9VN29_9HYME|nr:hypothetical protein KPH14_005924 [Odynerus spinipes]